MYYERLCNIDRAIIKTIRQLAEPAGRGALFGVFFWFGFLKLLGTSPANPLVETLLMNTMPFWNPGDFFIFLGLWEMLIGISFLVVGWERLAIALLAPHMITTFLPFFFLSDMVWQAFLTPTLEGQYIIKNLVIIALALTLAARLVPLDSSQKNSRAS